MNEQMSKRMNKPSRSILDLVVTIEAQELTDLPSNSVFNKKNIYQFMTFSLGKNLRKV